MPNGTKTDSFQILSNSAFLKKNPIWPREIKLNNNKIQAVYLVYLWWQTEEIIAEY